MTNKKTHFGFKEVDEKDKSSHVGDVFSSVAGNYDIMNDAIDDKDVIPATFALSSSHLTCLHRCKDTYHYKKVS